MKLDTMPKRFTTAENITRQIRDLMLSFEYGEVTWSEFHNDLEALLDAKREL